MHSQSEMVIGNKDGRCKGDGIEGAAHWHQERQLLLLMSPAAKSEDICHVLQIIVEWLETFIDQKESMGVIEENGGCRTAVWTQQRQEQTVDGDTRSSGSRLRPRLSCYSELP